MESRGRYLHPGQLFHRGFIWKKALQAGASGAVRVGGGPKCASLGGGQPLGLQKGLDLLAEAIEPILEDMPVQFVLLGSGDKDLEAYYGGLPARFPGRAGCVIGYDNELAHWIEAGADMFLMPSRYEPCGLNQIYSLRYGTLPIVHATGGLEDTVEAYDESTGQGTGFKFDSLDPRAIYYTVGWAVSTFSKRADHWQQMVKRAMAERFYWMDSARQYERAYRQAIEQARSA